MEEKDKPQVENGISYEPPKIVSYYENELLDLMGPAHTCSTFSSCAFFSGAVVGC